MSIAVILADDHTIVRGGLAALLSLRADIAVVGEAADGEHAVEMARSLKPRVIVMDIGMPGIGGTDATRRIVECCGETKVLALSAFSDRQHVLSALRAGASGYVLKDCAMDELVTAIHAVADGQRYVSPSLSHAIIHECVSTTARGSKDMLTSREREVLQLLAEGKAMKQVAIELHISTKTVETHRRAMMEKLQLFSVAELTKHALREGLTSLD